MWRELKIQIRTLLRNRIFALAAAISLALGLAVSTTVFSLVDAVFWKPLPVPDPGRLVSIYTQSSAGGTPAFISTSYADFDDFSRLPAFAHAGAFARFPVRLRSEQGMERLSAEMVSPGYFDVLGISPVLGRFLDAADHAAGAEPSAVISYVLWDRLFAKDRNALGKRITLNNRAFTIVGVAPAGYRGTVLDWYRPPDSFIPLSQAAAVEPGFAGLDIARKRDLRWLVTIARVAPGVSMKEAQAALDVAGAGLAREFPDTNRTQTFRLLSGTQGRFWPGRREESIRFAAFLAAVALAILLIACCNLSGTLIARTLAREHEIGVRMALGAGKWRIVRDSLIEALLLAVFGAALSIPVSLALSGGLRAFPAPFLVPIAVDIAPDWRTASFLALASILAAMIAGGSAGWNAAGRELQAALKKRSAYARHAFLVAQVALSFLVTAGAGLLAKSLTGLERADAGYQTGGVTVARVELPAEGMSAQKILALAEAIPGVDQTALASEIFPTLNRNPRPVRAPDSGIELTVERTHVSPAFFDTLRMPFIEGRAFGSGEPRPSVIVNRTAARVFWKDGRAVGKRLRLRGETEDREVIGVVRDAKYHELDESPAPHLFLPMALASVGGDPAILVHSSRGIVSGAVLRRTLGADRDLLVTESEPLAEYIAARLSQPRLAAFLAAGVAIAGMLLSAIGLHSILAYFVTRQRREIGIRVALGATRMDVVGSIARRGMMLGLAGVTLGFLLAFLGMQVVRSQLHGVAVSDPTIYLAATAIFNAVCAAACIGPAWRAARTDPASLLRSN